VTAGEFLFSGLSRPGACSRPIPKRYYEHRRERRHMKILDRILSKGTRQENPDDLMKIARIIGPLVDNTAHEILIAYNKELLTEPISYIAPAVWGEKKNGTLTPPQQEMHKKIVPVINEIMELLELEELGEPQKFTIGFIIRGYIISKITYMIEMVKNQGINIAVEDKKNDILDRIEPLGNA
jgi:hypothetical protein